MVFVDTGGWYASVVTDDPRHADVTAWLAANPARILTTDYVIDETLTLLRARGEPTRAVLLGRRLFDLRETPIHFIDETDLKSAWEMFRDQPSRRWSFTDCTSRAVIQRKHIKQALTFDRHFLEFGGLTVVP